MRGCGSSFAATSDDRGGTSFAEVGRGYYNAGRLTDAVRYLERSNAVEANAVALEQLGVPAYVGRDGRSGGDAGAGPGGLSGQQPRRSPSEGALLCSSRATDCRGA